MGDMPVLWAALAPFSPIVLTGVPGEVVEAPANKVAWVRRHLGPDVRVICCRSKDKSLHAAPGDVLIDDWTKYQHLWVAKGGRWVTHTSAAETVSQLSEMGVL